MKKIFLTFLAITVFLAAAPSYGLKAQDYVAPPVTVSKEKVRMDGKLYYSHIVLEKQTLYSIAKAYGVEIDDIYAANPSLKENGLKKNAIILVPAVNIQEAAPAPVSEEKKTVKEDKANARKAAREDRKRKKAAQKDFFIHTVRWYENLEVISEKYGVPVEVIQKVNGLDGKKLKNRQQLMIPTNPEKYVSVDEKPGSVDTGDSREDTVATRPVPADDIISVLAAGDKVNALLMLPFNAGGDSPSQISMDFYCGVLLAAKELGDSGADIDLSVYDTYGDALPITAERLEKSDFVIGPPSQKGLYALLEICPEKTYVISPLDTRTENLTAAHSNFIQVPVSQEAQYEDLLAWISEEKTARDSVIIIYEKGIKDLRKETEFRQLLDRSGFRHSAFSYSILEGRDVLDAMGRLMTAEGVNRVLVASESEAFVNDVVRNLNLLIHNKYNIVLYGASRIRSYETIDVANLHNASFHSSLSYYIDYDTPEVMDFLMKFRALFNTEPTQMAFQGYDIMYYFSRLCSTYGDSWAERLTTVRTPMLMSDFIFEKKGDGLSRNTVRRVIYEPDYSVTLIR